MGPPGLRPTEEPLRQGTDTSELSLQRRGEESEVVNRPLPFLSG